jgi:hypothetical protein
VKSVGRIFLQTKREKKSAPVGLSHQKGLEVLMVVPELGPSEYLHAFNRLRMLCISRAPTSRHITSISQ